MDFQTTDTFLTEEVFAKRAENSQIVTTGGYYYKKLLIDPAPAIILWTQDNQIEAYHMMNDQYNLIRSVPVASVLKATLGQGTLTMKVDGQPLFNLLLDEEFRKETLDGMKKNIIRDATGVAVSNPGLDAALDTANLKTDLDYFKNAKKATTMDWAELFKAHQVKTSNSEAMEMPDLFGSIKKLFKK
ncbi:hypothetical protein A9Q68_08995 [Streptococcus bovimastitidis]|uniref:Uncharacterized protein n=1 Tax=Streptococcus bovimastitidis TaxID=1856638 RepID=A0A1L8MKL3_9STRE|nr:hypothetical protein [Streptococcus bovimastitidis]OJF71322.1 hypothetical protein A9Q68_08995 [Streptococcus bovimastitidis]